MTEEPFADPTDLPEGSVVSGGEVARLDALAHLLRAECPWDREQDERSIVPHTVEEAYELADAAAHGDDAKLLDELGDVLFQVVFLSLLLEERGAGSLGAVADVCSRKLIRRHPHVFGEAVARSAGEVLANWDAIKRTEEGRGDAPFGELPETLPSLLHARKLQRRAGLTGLGPGEDPVAEALAALEAAADEARGAAADGENGGPTADAGGRDRVEAAVGRALFAATALARELAVDPELALRRSSGAFRERVERAVALAEADGRSWKDLERTERESYLTRVST